MYCFVASPAWTEGQWQPEGSLELVAFAGASGSQVFLPFYSGTLALWDSRNEVSKGSTCLLHSRQL